ncbi:MAG: ATP-grasp domain-containing protein [Bacteroidota bacterium]
MEAKTVLVTGIGGNVGQGILRNISSLNYPIRLVGTNTIEFTAGNHLVDAFYKTPFAYDTDFLKIVIDIISKEKVDLVIPSTDYESYYLALNSDKLPCKLATSSSNATGIYLDKFLTWQFHHKHNISFAESILPSAYQQSFSKAIAKPRKGRGSRGLIKNVKDVSGLSDEEYMVQEQIDGNEITTAVYNSYLTGEVIGLITMERTLDNGATNYCRVITTYDDELLKMAKLMTEKLNLKGAYNIQSIVNNNNEIVPFEINCRISGTNSIRSNFGFKDVKYTIDELLYNIKPENPVIIKGEAHRILLDVIYSEGTNNGNNKDNFLIF